MRGPDGTEWPNVVTYQEVVAPERLVYLHGDDKESDMFHNTVTFEDQAGKTALTMRAVFKTGCGARVRRPRTRGDRGRPADDRAARAVRADDGPLRHELKNPRTACRFRPDSFDVTVERGKCPGRVDRMPGSEPIH
jgi:hypothetical protein